MAYFTNIIYKIGTSICYFIGFYGGNRLLYKIINKFPKTKTGIQSSWDKFHKYGAYAVCFGRMIPICRTYIAFIAGSAKQKYQHFLLYSLIGITIWNSILIGMGYFLRENWK